MKKVTCGQCSEQHGLIESVWPVWTKTGRVKIINSSLCGDCRKQARRVVARAIITGRLAL